MKKTAFFLILLTILPSLVCCREEYPAEKLMNDFLYSYGATGTVYSPSRAEGEYGYVTPSLLSLIYVYDGDFPENFAIYLNPKSDYGSECGFFVAESEDERERILDMCEERLALITRGEGGLIITRGRVVFYSAMSDTERAGRVARRVISR